MNVLRTLQKKASAKAISMILVVAMLFGALPASPVLVASAADAVTNLKLHLMVQSGQDFKQPALNAWNAGDITVSGNDGEVTPKSWGSAVKKMTKGTTSDAGVTEYTIEIKGKITGMQLLDVNTDSENASRYQADVYDTAMEAFTDAEPKDLYAVYDAEKNAYTWYTDAACQTKLELAKPAYFTVHYLNSDNWEEPRVNYWNDSQVQISDTDGTAAKPTSWNQDGTLPKMTKEAEQINDYDSYKVTFKGTITGFQILNGTNGEYKIAADVPKYADTITSLNALTGDTPADVYLLDGKVYFTLEELSNIEPPAATKTDLTIHFKNSKNWAKVWTKFGEGNSWDPIAGYEYCKEEVSQFGAPVYENSKNTGWYSFNIKKNNSYFAACCFRKTATN